MVLLPSWVVIRYQFRTLYVATWTRWLDIARLIAGALEAKSIEFTSVHGLCANISLSLGDRAFAQRHVGYY